jgi:hypothetical protein
MLATEHVCWPLDIYCGHWIDGQILADGGTLGKRKHWDSGKFGWSRFDQEGGRSQALESKVRFADDPGVM